MSHIVVVLASLNQTALLKRALYRQGIFVDMMRTPRCLSSTGCSFALKCNQSEFASLEEQCRNLGITHGGVFEENEDSACGEYRSLNGQV